MPKTLMQTNQQLPGLSGRALSSAKSDVVDKITRVDQVMRDKNNIILGKKYRLDVKPMARDGDRYKKGDFKLDIQTVEAQKKNSETVGLVFLSKDAKSDENTLAALTESLNESLEKKKVYYVS